MILPPTTLPEGTVLFIDGPIQVFISPGASGEEILQAWARVERYVKVAAVQLDRRRYGEQLHEKLVGVTDVMRGGAADAS